jgi:hypothetical protein
MERFGGREPHSSRKQRAAAANIRNNNNNNNNNNRRAYKGAKGPNRLLAAVGLEVVDNEPVELEAVAALVAAGKLVPVLCNMMTVII